MAQLSGKHIAALITDGFEEAELTGPVQAYRDAGAVVDIISEKAGPIQAFNHNDPSRKIDAEKAFDDVSPDDYDALLLPGGALNADYIRTVPQAQAFVKAFASAQKPIAVICHAPWLLISTGVVRGRTLTSFPSIQDDVRNAGGNWVDREVCVDGNLVTSRKPDDIPAFNREAITLFASSSRKATASAR